ncbi:hypothetical protein J3F84DRAFT_315459 [Trichoderma pleuroticola]
MFLSFFTSSNLFHLPCFLPSLSLILAPCCATPAPLFLPLQTHASRRLHSAAYCPCNSLAKAVGSMQTRHLKQVASRRLLTCASLSNRYSVCTSREPQSHHIDDPPMPCKPCSATHNGPGAPKQT